VRNVRTTAMGLPCAVYNVLRTVYEKGVRTLVAVALKGPGPKARRGVTGLSLKHRLTHGVIPVEVSNIIKRARWKARHEYQANIDLAFRMLSLATDRVLGSGSAQVVQSGQVDLRL
jgi:hypothetical protein